MLLLSLLYTRDNFIDITYIDHTEMKVFSSKNQKTGERGEVVASMFLKQRGFDIKERNYTKPWGEIDIIAEKSGVIHFCEVKTVSCKTLPLTQKDLGNVYNPGENITQTKMDRFWRTVQSYLLENELLDDTKWSIDAVLVFMEKEGKRVSVQHLDHIL